MSRWETAHDVAADGSWKEQHIGFYIPDSWFLWTDASTGPGRVVRYADPEEALFGAMEVDPKRVKDAEKRAECRKRRRDK